MGVVVAVVALVVAVATYLTWLARRLDRLHARTDGAWASLDAQLLRRAAAALDYADAARAPGLAAAARAAQAAGAQRREAAENDVSRALHAALAAGPPGGRALEDLAAACARLVIARRFYNDAVRDTRALRGRRLVRALHLAGHAPLPRYFEVDDVPPAALGLPEAATPR